MSILPVSVLMGGCGNPNGTKDKGAAKESSQTAGEESETGTDSGSTADTYGEETEGGEGTEEVQEPVKPVTIGDLTDYLIKAADDYNGEKDRKALLDGLDEQVIATRAVGMELLSRAFGELPEPTGNNARISDKDVSFTDVPQFDR